MIAVRDSETDCKVRKANLVVQKSYIERGKYFIHINSGSNQYSIRILVLLSPILAINVFSAENKQVYLRELGRFSDKFK